MKNEIIFQMYLSQSTTRIYIKKNWNEKSPVTNLKLWFHGTTKERWTNAKIYLFIRGVFLYLTKIKMYNFIQQFSIFISYYTHLLSVIVGFVIGVWELVFYTKGILFFFVCWHKSNAGILLVRLIMELHYITAVSCWWLNLIGFRARSR